MLRAFALQLTSIKVVLVAYDHCGAGVAVAVVVVVVVVVLAVVVLAVVVLYVQDTMYLADAL
jgi:hypothetical protein